MLGHNRNEENGQFSRYSLRVPPDFPKFHLGMHTIKVIMLEKLLYLKIEWNSDNNFKKLTCSTSGYDATQMLSACSIDGRDGNRCQSSSVMKGMNGDKSRSPASTHSKSTFRIISALFESPIY